MWPLLLIIILASGESKKKKAAATVQMGCKPGDVYGTGIASVNTHGFKVPLSTQTLLFDVTENELNAIITIMMGINAGTVDVVGQAAFDKGDVGWRNPWGLCSWEKVAEAAEVELDEYGALAMQAYWLATKSNKPRPWPEVDLEVLEKDPVYPYGGGAEKIPLAEYLVERIKRYKAIFIAQTKKQ